LVPAFHTYEKEGAYSQTKIKFSLPEKWTVKSSWENKSRFEFIVDNPERRFDRPVGWFIVGQIGTRQANISGTSVTVASPKASGMQRMEALTFFSFVWPQVKKTFGQVPEKLLIVGAPDPMWRGGLSSPNSLYLHVDRPIVSENGTSPLFHEITHMITRIRGKVTDKHNDDWIAEGLAEYYSFELLHKAGGISKNRKKKILEKLTGWGRGIKHLRQSKSTGPVTARAVVLFAELDQEIQQKSQNKYDLGDVTKALMKKREVSFEDLRQEVEELIDNSKTLNDSVLK
jgi:predicted metalloprotease with PDZ domain